VPPDENDDAALKRAIDLLRGAAKNSPSPPRPGGTPR
jgi:hypothetical protein